MAQTAPIVKKFLPSKIQNPFSLLFCNFFYSIASYTFLTLSELTEAVLPQSAQISIHFFFISQHTFRIHLLEATSLTTLHWWRKVRKARRIRKKAQLLAGFEPTISWLWVVLNEMSGWKFPAFILENFWPGQNSLENSRCSCKCFGNSCCFETSD